MNDTPWIEARTIDQENARETFALAARHLLSDVAMEYHQVIYLPDFAAKLQERTRIRYRATPSSWIGDVLYRVARECQRRSEPFLGALVVNSDSSMPEWWADTVEALRGEVVAQSELHAAVEREALYRLHGAEIPEDAEATLADPAPTPVRAPRARTATTRTSTSATRVPGTAAAAAPKAPRAPKPAKPVPEVRLTQAVEKFCSSCFMVLPATGLCDECD